MSFIQNLFLSRDNNANGANYVGQQDRIWWNPDTNAFYYSDGNTPGGIIINTGGGGNGVPGGPTNSIQINAGNGSFTGTNNLTFNGTVVSIVGNVSANYFIGNGSQLTGLPTNYSNANVATFLGDFGSNAISTSGNIAGNYFIGDGSQLSNLPSGASNKIYNGNSSANIAAADGNLVINVGTDGYGLWTFETGTGNLIGPGNVSQGAGIVLSAEQNVYIREDMGDLSMSANSHIYIRTDSGNVGNTRSWTFAPSGNLTLPAGGTISDFDGGYPNSTGTSINGVDYAQLYWNGDPGNSNPYTGGNLYTWAFVDGNSFNVQHRDVANSINSQWNFNKTGNLTVPGNITFRSSNASIFTANTFGNIGNVGNLIGFVNGVDAGNFPNYFALDQNGNVHIGQNTGNSTGAIIFDGGYSQIYESAFGGLVLQPSFDPFGGVGNVTIATANGNSYVYLRVIGDANIDGDLGADGVYSNSVSTTGAISAAGNITGAFYYGDGGYLSNINGANITNGYGNSNVATFLADFGSNSISTSGNITGNYIIGDGSQLTNLPAQPGTYGNGNVATFLADFGSNAISTSGNITASGLLIDTVTGITSNAGNIDINQITGLGGYLNAFGANFSGDINAVNLSLSGNIISDANISGNVNAANISAGNISLSGNIFAYGANIYSVNGLTMEGGNLTMSSITGMGGSISAEGNIIGANLSATGNVSGQNINGGNLSLSGNVLSNLNIQQGNISVSGNITSGSELTVVSANITGVQGLTVSGGDITIPSSMSGGSLSAHGNVTANYIKGDGSQLTNLPVQPGTYDNSNVATFLADFGSNTISTSGNITGNYFIGNATNALTAGTVYTNAQPNITTIGTLTSLSVTGNTQSGNLLTGGSISATGNISANTYTGNGSQLTGVANIASVQRVLGLTMIYGGR
jgi:hypothetical protein